MHKKDNINGGILKIKINYVQKNISNETMKNKNNITLYLFGFLPIKIKIDRDMHSKKSKSKFLNSLYIILKQIVKSLKFNEINQIMVRLLKSISIKYLDMDLGINLKDPILNAYTIAIINCIIPLLVQNNTHSINLNKIKYNTFISENLIFLRINCIISFSIVKNIPSIIKIIFVLVKGGIKNGNKTSNRISNDNIYDFNRGYGRC